MDGTTTLSEFDFPVELVNLSTAEINGCSHPVPANLARAVIRTDTNDVLGVHGSRYAITSHSQVVDAVTQSVRRANLSNDWTLTTDVYENGALMKGTISFNDLVIEPAVGDYVRFDANFWNSYNGQWSIQIVAEGRRLFCLNGCSTPHSVAKTFKRHTGSIDMEQESGKLEKALSIFFEQKDVWQHYMSARLGPMSAERFLRQQLCAYPKKTQLGQPQYNERQSDLLYRQYMIESKNLGRNAWALYNTMTHWASHPDTAKPYNSERDRSNKVAAALRSDAWKQLVS